MLPWSSLFSENVSAWLHTIESWISSIFVRFDLEAFFMFMDFFFLFLVTIGPWFIFLAYDLILYVFRTITYEIPFVGGRARGKERPRAPSLKERPSGDPRVVGIGVPGATYVEDEDLQEEEKIMSGQATPHDPQDEPRATANNKKTQAVNDTGLAQDESDDDVDDQPQRVFSIGGQQERESWTEVNARRRMGFKDEDGPA